MFRFFLLIFFTSSLLISCSEQADSAEDEALNVILRSPINPDGTVDSTMLPILVFERMTWDFDTIDQGASVSYDFKFKNTGKADLLISDVQTSCGCTITEYEKNAIKPGEESKLSFKFDSTDKYGKQDKSITIYANTYPNKTVVNFTGYVKTKD